MSQKADPHDPARIDEVLAELHRVWKRNPRKTLSQVIAKAITYSAPFVPDDATDADILTGLRAIGPGLPAPEWSARA